MILLHQINSIFITCKKQTKQNKLWAMLSKTASENCKMTSFLLSTTYFIFFGSSLESWDYFYPYFKSSPSEKHV